jgi:hypothetical protein
MTRDEFAKAYADRGGLTVEKLRAYGREARPCHCGEAICEGWQMAHVSDEDWPEDSDFPKSDPRFQA